MISITFVMSGGQAGSPPRSPTGPGVGFAGVVAPTVD